MNSLKTKLLCEYKNKKCVYYNTLKAKNKLYYTKQNLISNLNRNQIKFFKAYEAMQKSYEDELINEVFEFLYDYIKTKFEI